MYVIEICKFGDLDTSMLNLRETQTNEHVKFAELLSAVERAWAKQGVHVKPSNIDAVYSLPLEVVTKAISFLQDIVGAYESGAFGESGLELEKMFLKRALERFGYYVDDSFWNVLEDGDVIEVYNSSMTQLYRSRSFFEITGYSLLDLTANEWYHLFERPAKIQQMMMEQVENILKKASNTPTLLDIPVHLMKERCDLGFVEPPISRAVEVKFKYLASIKKHPLKPADGFIVTCRARLLGLGEETKNIDFI